MWVLYSIKRNNQEFKDALLSRLRPAQTYLIVKKGKLDPEAMASIVLGPYSQEEVGDIKRKPEIMLKQIKSAKVEALVNDRAVQNEHYLFDGDLIRISIKDTRYRVKWENFTIFVDDVDDKEYKYLVELGAKLGIHVVKEWTKHVTHVYISGEPQENLSPAIFKGLISNKYFITKKWIENAKFDQVTQDRAHTLSALNDTIERIVWKDFPPAKQPAILGPDKRRKTLFKMMDFTIFDRAQSKRLAPMIEACGGTWVYVDLNSGESVDFNHKSLIVVPPESSNIDANEWEILLERYTNETKMMRQIAELEIGWAILYCATNYMCNPASSMASVILSMDADKKENPSCSVNATVPYCSESIPPEEATMPYNSDAATMSHNSDAATMPYNSDAATMPHNSVAATIPYNSDGATMPYNFEEEDDQKIERNNQCNMSTARQNFETVSSEREATPTHRSQTQTREATPVSESTSVYDTAPVHEPSSTREAPENSHTTSNDNNFSREASPIREISPMATSFPAHDVHPDEKATSPLASVSPEPDALDDYESMDINASLPDPMTDLNDFFSDFVGAMKPKPPPKKAPALSSPAIEDVRQEPINNRQHSPGPSLGFPSQNRIKTEPLAESSPARVSISPAPPSPLNDQNVDDVDQTTSSPSLGKRALPTAETSRPIKRKRVLTREEEQAEEEAEDAKIEPTTPPTSSSTDRPASSPSTMKGREDQVGAYSRVIYAPLVVHNRPSPSAHGASQPSSRSSNGVNYKKFKKVKQFEYENEMDIVYLVSSSQRLREESHQQRRPPTQTSGARIEDTEIYDPDLFIRSARRRA